MTKATSLEEKRQLQEFILRNDVLLNKMKEELKNLGEKLQTLRKEIKDEQIENIEDKPNLVVCFFLVKNILKNEILKRLFTQWVWYKRSYDKISINNKKIN